MQKVVLIFVCSFMLFLLAAYSGQTYSKGASRHIFRVELIVTCKNKNLKNRIISLASSDLRALGDVVVTNHQPDYKIDIVALTVHADVGYKLGHAVSVVITRPGVNWEWALSKDLSKGVRDRINKLITSNDVLVNTELVVGKDAVLGKNLSGVIADFDVGQLKPLRQRYNSGKSKSGEE